MRVKVDLSFKVYEGGDEYRETDTEYICDSIREAISLIERVSTDTDIYDLSYKLFTLNPITEKWEEERCTMGG